MKKIQKRLLIVLITFIIFFIQHQFTNKTQKTNNDVLRQKVELVRVVDGDTLIVKKDGKNERVRLVGMNAPESVKPKSPIECFGLEASNHAKEIIKNKKLEFLADSSQASRDRFGRLLGYIFIDKDNFAERMIADGYAYEYTYHKNHPYQYQLIFKDAEHTAQREKRGLWVDGACDNH